jgi:predicted helicase
LSELLSDFAAALARKDISITTLPKETDAGNPDFRVWDGTQHIVGYLEAKAPSCEHLDTVEQSEQLKRYLATFPNVILTNFLEFRLYRNGERIAKAVIGRSAVLLKLQQVPPLEREHELIGLLEKFFSFVLPKQRNAEELAQELAKRTRFLRDEIIALEQREGEKLRVDSILGFYQAFRDYLIAGLTYKSFADLYAQTVTYGLFAARTRATNGFNRRLAYSYIPPTIGILRDIFQFVSQGKLPEAMNWIIDDIVEVLANADPDEILRSRTQSSDLRPRDPIIHFYETFLAQYDPVTREKRGVYYTPEPAVRYIVESLHRILQEHFQRSEGLADESVTVLDPAAGTGTFLVEAARKAVTEHENRYGAGSKTEFVRKHILADFYAFELMMAPYAVGHLKISYMLRELGFALEDEDRFKLYLTNTLEWEDLAQTKIPGIASLAEESHLAGKVKKETPILVILGNPPYSGHSANFGDWIVNKVREYHKVDGKPLGEKNPKWLQDDYVKFIRFAQWKLDQAGEGVLGFVTNHSYLDNPTFRGMRASLMTSFDEIYVLDLHGNALKKEKCPDGSKDQNVFDIRQGVAISIFVKKKGKKKGCSVFHAECWGLREQKYDWLSVNSIRSTHWKKLSPKPPHYLFVPRDEDLLHRYLSFPQITEIFPVNSVGIVTARDRLTIRWTPEEVWNTVMHFVRQDPESARMAFELGNDAQDWKVKWAQDDLKKSGPDRKNIVPILYRPFDIRYTYYTGKSQGFHCRPRPEVMQHMLKENLALITRRQMLPGLPCNYFFVTKYLVSDGAIRSDNKGGESVFPLFKYIERKEEKSSKSSSVFLLFEPKETYRHRIPNLSEKILKALKEAFPKPITPIQIFSYVYAISYSKIYRNKYAEYLRMDFPRVPFTTDYPLFTRLAKLGEKLVELHLLRDTSLTRPIAKFPEVGDRMIRKIRYDNAGSRVFINETQFFDGVPGEVWQYRIGGYQVCEKWLKERRGRELGYGEPEQYCKIITALYKTIQIQKEIDAIYPDVEKNLIQFD